MSNKPDLLRRILLAEDNPDNAELYSQLLSGRGNVRIDSYMHPGQALSKAREILYDIVAIDVTMDFKGTPFGGLELYKDLVDHYGRHSIIAYSKAITDDLLKTYGYDFNFLDAGSNPMRFIDQLWQMFIKLRRMQTCFVVMPFDSKYDHVYKAINKVIMECSFCCVRLDKIHFTKSIIQKMFEEIRNSKFVIFFSTDRNPNAFYEAGYANALGKAMITLTRKYEELPFDIRDLNAIEYKDDLKLLQNELRNRIKGLFGD